MIITKRFSQDQSIRKLNPEELSLGINVFKKNFDLQSGEKVLVVTDEPFLMQEAAIWFESAKQLTDEVSMIVLDKVSRSGEEPPEEILQACSKAQVSVLHTSLSITHTRARKAAHSHQNRCASLPMVDRAMMVRTLSIDYLPIHETGERLINHLRKASGIYIQSQAGTDLQATVNPELLINDDGMLQTAGGFGNLPAGEVFWAPKREDINGVWVVNGSLADFNLESPITIQIEKGIAVEFKGGKQAEAFKQKLLSVGEDGLKIAELGLGTNPMANPRAELIEAEKAYATAHIAFGNNAGFGGDNHIQIHLDGVTLNPTITLDERIIVDQGKIL